MTHDVMSELVESDEPSIRYKVLTGVLGAKPSSSKVKLLRDQIASSARVKQLLSERRADGTIPYHPYAKWYGAHWVLVALADLGYPPGDADLAPLREQVYAWLLGEKHARSIRTIDGRVRRCASQEGNAVFSLLTLGLADERTEELAARLLRWQWPDGGWNCDKHPAASNSSFMETLIPLRALALHGRLASNAASTGAAERAAEVFLKRRLFRRQRDGRVMDDHFLELHYPCYWHYDILAGLKAMAEAGRIKDRRCREALGVLEHKRLEAGGFPAEAKYYRVSPQLKAGRSLVDWGGTSQTRMNQFVTADALAVLAAAGLLKVRCGSQGARRESQSRSRRAHCAR